MHTKTRCLDPESDCKRSTAAILQAAKVRRILMLSSGRGRSAIALFSGRSSSSGGANASSSKLFDDGDSAGGNGSEEFWRLQ